MSLSGRKKRREVNLYSYYDHAGIVRHLEELARQGKLISAQELEAFYLRPPQADPLKKKPAPIK